MVGRQLDRRAVASFGLVGGRKAEEQHDQLIGLREGHRFPDHCHRADRGQIDREQGPIVVQQHSGFGRCPPRDLVVGVEVDNRPRLAGLIGAARQEAQPLGHAVDHGFVGPWRRQVCRSAAGPRCSTRSSGRTAGCA